MAKNTTEKYNDACIKIFEFMKMLYEDEADFNKVINLFSDGNYDGTSNTHVTLNKYLNTLKIFGIKVKKIDRKYKLISPLYNIKFTPEDIKSIMLLKSTENFLPEGKQKKLLDKFLKNLELRFEDNIKDKYMPELKVKDPEILSSDIIKLTQLCEKYCQENFKLEIVYLDENNNSINLLCSPIETFFVKKQAKIKVLGNNGNRIYEIPIGKIQTIKQLPVSKSSASIPITVVYRIKNRLAKNYKMRDWEKLDKIESDGSKIIINKEEDLELLAKRLMRYSTECDVISPKFFKEEMLNLINKTLSNYQ